MTSFVASKVAKHVLKEHASNRFGSDDPYYEHIAAPDMAGSAAGNGGKTVKRRRPVPPGLTKHEEKVLKKVTRRAHRLDNCMNICGMRVGWGAVVGIVPGIGDVLDSFMALMVVYTCSQVDLPPTLRSRMMLNVIIDFTIGIIPFLGDVADAIYKANTRNAALLYKHLQERGAARLKQQGGETPDEARSRRDKAHNLPGQRSRSHSRKRDRITPAGGPQQTTGQPSKPSDKAADKLAPPAQAYQPTGPKQDMRYVTPGDIQTPAPAKTKESRPKRSGWLSRFSTSRDHSPDPDPELGEQRAPQR